jgi:queuine tRNA-ribosyltransferase
MFNFRVLKKSKKSSARTGVIQTPHGEIRTPAFLPVGTLGVVKGGLDSRDLTETGVQAQITNTFHFLDLDAVETVKKAGGLHKFFGFHKPIFTDSGGFQVFSLGEGMAYGFRKIHSFFPGKDTKLEKRDVSLVKITEEGARFRSPRDGREIMLTPEYSAEIQKKLGADFIYLLDICGTVVEDKTRAASDLGRTERWFERFLKVTNQDSNKKSRMSTNSQLTKNRQSIFGIVQGGLYKDLRIASAKAVSNLPVFGIAIGGAVGKTKKEMYDVLDVTIPHCDPLRPRHLLGIGDLETIPEFLKRGIDIFDCAMPTRIARHGTAIAKKGYININKSEFKNKFQPIEKGCHCKTCAAHTLAEIHFLLKGRETLAGRLITIHNLFFLENYLEEIRQKIEIGKF